MLILSVVNTISIGYYKDRYDTQYLEFVNRDLEKTTAIVTLFEIMLKKIDSKQNKAPVF